jgi:hypothetical protein
MKPPSLPQIGQPRQFWIFAALGIVAVVCFIALLTGTKPSINPVVAVGNIQLQSAANQAVKKDYRNGGVEFSAYYKSDFSQSVLVLDLQKVSGTNSKADVFRVLLDIAQEMKDESFETVELSHAGTAKFILDGVYFRQLGVERGYQNPAYTLRTFPENLRTPTGTPAYGQWTGGIIGVLNQQMKDFNDFHDKWYLDDLRAGL